MKYSRGEWLARLTCAVATVACLPILLLVAAMFSNRVADYVRRMNPGGRAVPDAAVAGIVIGGTCVLSYVAARLVYGLLRWWMRRPPRKQRGLAAREPDPSTESALRAERGPADEAAAVCAACVRKRAAMLLTGLALVIAGTVGYVAYWPVLGPPLSGYRVQLGGTYRTQRYQCYSRLWHFSRGLQSSFCPDVKLWGRHYSDRNYLCRNGERIQRISARASRAADVAPDGSAYAFLTVEDRSLLRVVRVADRASREFSLPIYGDVYWTGRHTIRVVDRWAVPPRSQEITVYPERWSP